LSGVRHGGENKNLGGSKRRAKTLEKKKETSQLGGLLAYLPIFDGSGKPLAATCCTAAAAAA
jgi:hypothetical protein